MIQQFMIKMIVAAVFLLFRMAQAEEGYHLLTIEKIRCVTTATGIDTAAKAGAASLAGLVAATGSLIAAGVITVGTGGAAAPLTAAAVASAAATGNAGAAGALKFLETADKLTKGVDDLIVKVDGKTVFPIGAESFPMNANDEIYPNIKTSFKYSARLDLIEYDSGSDNDALGGLTIPKGDYRLVDVIVMSNVNQDMGGEYEDEGAVYQITYTVEKDKGVKADTVEYMLCGTNQCNDCPDFNQCKNIDRDYGDLDRDKDYGDLRRCPKGFKQNSYNKYPQLWPAADVYLRLCDRDSQYDGQSLEVLPDIWEGKDFGEGITWDEAAEKIAPNTLPDITEVQALVECGPIPNDGTSCIGEKVLASGQDMWIPVYNQGRKDWVQIGDTIHTPGKSHINDFGYPGWGDSAVPQPHRGVVFYKKTASRRLR